MAQIAYCTGRGCIYRQTCKHYLETMPLYEGVPEINAEECMKNDYRSYIRDRLRSGQSPESLHRPPIRR